MDTRSTSVIVLRCPWLHVTLWPADLEPTPATCLAQIAPPSPVGQDLCGLPLTSTRVLHGDG